MNPAFLRMHNQYSLSGNINSISMFKKLLVERKTWREYSPFTFFYGVPLWFAGIAKKITFMTVIGPTATARTNSEFTGS